MSGAFQGPTDIPESVFTASGAGSQIGEMLTRLGAMLPYNVRGMWIGTFHGLCNRLLRAHWQLAGLPQRAELFFDALAREFGTGLEPGELELDRAELRA